VYCGNVEIIFLTVTHIKHMSVFTEYLRTKRPHARSWSQRDLQIFNLLLS